MIAARRDAVIKAMTTAGSTLMVTDAMPDIRWFTGCQDAGGFLILNADGSALLITNAHDAPQARAEAIDTIIHEWWPSENPMDILRDELSGRVVTPSLSGAVASQLSGIDLVFQPAMTSHLRRVRSTEELTIIRQAARIVEAGMSAARDALRPGIREFEVAAAAEYAMRLLGSDGRVFETKVESGYRSAWPSTYASDRVLEMGDLVLIDIGPTYRGFFGDLTRTFSIGQPGVQELLLLETVLKAQAAAISMVKAGVTGSQVDEAARSIIDEVENYVHFRHHTGHTLGLAGDSMSLIAPGVESRLLAGECITIEPGAYRKGTGGVRIEDELLVTISGSELITAFPKSLESLIISI